MTAGQAAALGVAVLTVALAGDSLWHAALAQNPFGGPRAVPDQQVGGIVGWVLAKQSEFYRAMSSTIRAAKSDGSAVWTLLGISFAYGVFHAAGPGHGKAVISSYLVANEETARRGIVLSFASALAQALVAVLIVGIGAWLLNVTAKTMCGTERIIEIVSYGLIAAFGARLVWSKGGGLLRAMQAARAKPAPELVPAMAQEAVLGRCRRDVRHGDRHRDHRRDHRHHRSVRKGPGAPPGCRPRGRRRAPDARAGICRSRAGAVAGSGPAARLRRGRARHMFLSEVF